MSIGKSLCAKQAAELPERISHTLGTYSSLEELSINDRARSKKKGEAEKRRKNIPLNNNGVFIGSYLSAARPSVAPHRTITVSRGRLEINSGYPISILDDIVISNGGKIDFHGRDYMVLKYINRITVKDSGVIYWGRSEGGGNKVYLNDLVINDGGVLIMDFWFSNGYDHLFVRKDSQGLADALYKMRFDNHGSADSVSGSAGVREYNKDYWEVGSGSGFHKLPVPEPATYGAAFSLGALGFVAWRRRRRRSLATA